MKKLMYFADGNGANALNEALTCAGDQVVEIKPVTVTTTVMYVSTKKDQVDSIVFTHDDTSTTSGHRVQDIAKAISEGSTAGPHVNGLTDMVDFDNSIFYGNLSFITSLVIAKDVAFSY